VSEFIQIINSELGLDLSLESPFFYSRRSVDDCGFIHLLKGSVELTEKLIGESD
jgi:hypothetical protein